MSVPVTAPMTDEARKHIALEYLKRLDTGRDVLELFDEHAQVFFPKCPLANGLDEIRALFGRVGELIAAISHDYAYFNYIAQGDTLVVEGTSSGTTTGGATWRAGVTHAGRWCDVFEIRDHRIQRLFIYLDPDYADADVARYPWLARS
ncbi:nuclear transport factor 2 family protein [Actinomycetospora termitidis]|uniref:Nuclear transport factor 2 family protein n=1 Tax=Actinomycetospora termitidis TaxID=3053470 RepID=A0ABT7MHF5_9PSEU|nr:nuclear transport factor 2 family protein [Actinomycetospora sp. Odt1-22]MDL5160113.1 nuclear transport factor 2 family protein [Actinomycetospora sp. Odt1-22]